MKKNKNNFNKQNADIEDIQMNLSQEDGNVSSDMSFHDDDFQD